MPDEPDLYWSIGGRVLCWPHLVGFTTIQQVGEEGWTRLPATTQPAHGFRCEHCSPTGAALLIFDKPRS